MPTCQGCDPSTDACQHCKKPKTEATMNCPTCTKLSLPPAHYCCQACFKAHWPTHKQLHKLVQDAQKQAAQAAESSSANDSHLAKFAGFEFTGSLRPAAISPQKTVPSTIPQPDYSITGTPESEIKSKRSHHIVQYTEDEISRMREAGILGRKALDLAHSMIKPGVTGDEIDNAVHDFIIKNGAYPSPLNYYNFPKSLCISVNEVICHGIPDKRPLQEGDIVNMDVTVYYKGMHADLNETVAVGKVDEDSIRLLEGAYNCLWSAIKMCKPGTMYRDLGNVITKVASAANLSVVKTYCGHGIGELFHTAPNVPHYAKNKAVGVMKPGHIFTIEPMINLGRSGDKTWPDDWTAVTVDGKRSAQFEHTILITETGFELLTGRLPDSPPFTFNTDADKMN